MKLVFDHAAWEDYAYWVAKDRKIAIRIAALLKDIERSPYDGVGKPEPLKHDLAGWWSRRIDQEHRLVYKVVDDSILIAQCRYHY